jgi:hypothetical protein
MEVTVSEQEKTKLDERLNANLIEEYKANVDLWIYEATFRQQRSQTFLTINSVLLVALGTLITINPSPVNASIIAILLSVFGFPACLMWRQIMIRNGAYMRFRRYQQRGIEAQLRNVTTIRNQWQALNQYKPLSLEGLEDTFEIKPSEKVSAITIENKLPLVLIWFWLIVFLGGVTIVGINLVRWLLSLAGLI